MSKKLLVEKATGKVMNIIRVTDNFTPPAGFELHENQSHISPGWKFNGNSFEPPQAEPETSTPPQPLRMTKDEFISKLSDSELLDLDTAKDQEPKIFQIRWRETIVIDPRGAHYNILRNFIESVLGSTRTAELLDG